MGSSWKLHAIFCNNMEINFDELAILKNLMPAAANDCNVFVTCLFINYGYLDGQSVWLQSERVGQNNCYHQATCVITLQLKVVTQRSLKSLGDVCRHNYLKHFSDHKKVIAITGKPPIFFHVAVLFLLWCDRATGFSFISEIYGDRRIPDDHA